MDAEPVLFGFQHLTQVNLLAVSLLLALLGVWVERLYARAIKRI